MPGDPDRPRGARRGAVRPRGEAARVAARVETLLREYRATHPEAVLPEAPSGAEGAADPAAVAWLDDVLPRGGEPLPWLDEPAEWEPVPDSSTGPAVSTEPVVTPGSAVSTGSAGERRPTVWQRIVGHVPVRLDPGRGSVLAVGVAVVLVAVVAGVWLVSHRPQALPVSASSHPPSGALGARTAGASAPAAHGPSGSISAGSAASPTVVVVDVAGKVRHPGLYRLPAGSRVDDALRAAGGARPGVDLSALNLAAKVADGQQIAVGVTGAPGGATGGGAGDGAAGGGGSGGSGAASGPVDLNTASLEQLETLPGVGPVLAQHILDFRSQHGRFGSVDQLREVSGIGDVRFAQLRPLVTV